ncbi:MAG: DUF3343 domain-containing protein [Christensenellaceae bacterium]|nr:DUF3343 domain-containing protein [Christensenellaceae bacterium]MDD6927113.1 DUF3343 domain-containing protein [bacterium]MDY2851029.1 DUF3343 domain-containing protein [Christensenellaceae bacterium]
MNTCLAVFLSSTSTRMFADKLRSQGVWCRIVPTPPEAGVGCGKSVEFSSCDLTKAKRIISSSRGSFAGLFEKRIIAGRAYYARIG